MTTSDPIVVEQSFDVSPARLWQAITDRDEMVQWFFDDIPEFRPEQGFQTQFDVDTGERVFRHLWTITEAVPGQKIVYDWRYEDFEGIGKVTFEVSPDGDGSKLRITNEGHESFTADLPEFTVESCIGGWKYFIQGALLEYLAKQATS